ncbi:MAG TPA: class I SAM-dependent methyltransferase [Methylomirabilota bacterium]|nr:class I SAM-dependent methyltransferase [Methylomirabilota bacterium]
MDRVLEPELMTDEDQALAYAAADFATPNQAFVDRFIALFPDFTRGIVADLGCGPADIPIRLCRALPGVTVTAVDGSEPMLAPARVAVAAAGLSGRICLVCARLPGMERPRAGFDGVISNSLLHHLPRPEVLWSELAWLGRADAAVLVTDLHRPHSSERAREIVETYSGGEPEVLKRDFFHSLCAAFTLPEVTAQIGDAGLDGALRCEMISDRHWAAWGRLPAIWRR